MRLNNVGITIMSHLEVFLRIECLPGEWWNGCRKAGHGPLSGTHSTTLQASIPAGEVSA